MFRLALFIALLFFHLCNSQIPPSPYGDADDICPSRNNKNYEVDGNLGTPFILTPFRDTFVNPPVLPPSLKECRSDGHCMFSYTIDVIDTTLRPFDRSVPACAKKPATKFLTYHKQVPGPTLIVPAGHESIVRFNNKIGALFPGSLSPCVGNRTGRPFSVHHRGSASIPSYDGWAEDETCFGETKEYVYPNHRPASSWYHDHALHITAENAYYGLAGYHLVTSKIKNGGCGEPWNLEDIEERHLILQDKVLDSNCQLFIDPLEAHEDNLYGDINMISGIPFPLIPLEPKWYRFRLLNAAASRPFLVRIKTSAGNDISRIQCRIIASEGGFRNAPIAFPAAGLLIGIGERYEVVCDFSTLRGQTLFMWNERDEDLTKDVPFFCYSHLLAKIQISAAVPASSPQFREDIPTPEPLRPLNRVLNRSDINTAIRMANNGQFHRRMQFGRENGQWVINGETWDSFKIAADDIGQNTWELWLFESGGGWFHPVHMHLVDFFIIKRDDDGGVRSYEDMSPKDVLNLGPSNKVWVIARFGPHKGDYMFHCHNLIHEDNDMMRAMRIINSENGLNAPTAQPFILNGFSNIVYSNWKFNNPLLPETAPRPTNQLSPLNSAYIQKMLTANIYRIFYPIPSDATLNGFTNPWRSTWCPV